jgi:DNA-binding NtrC family response regulator
MKTETMVLLVMPRNRRSELLEALEECTSDVLVVCDCKEARKVLGAKLPVEVVFTDAVLPDGGWSEVLEEVKRRHSNAQIVVCGRSRNAAERGEFLERGVCNLLTEPYNKEEVERIVGSAATRSCIEAEIGVR